MRRPLLALALLLVGATAVWPQARGGGGRAGGARPAAPADTFFVSPIAAADLQRKQAVVETSLGTMVFDLLADAAPTHVAHFIVRAREGAYDGTSFHRVITMGIVQGGDPLSKDPAQAAKYGTGGLNQLRFEPNAEKHTRGAVSAVLVPGRRDRRHLHQVGRGDHGVPHQHPRGVGLGRQHRRLAGHQPRHRRSAEIR